MSKAGKTVLLVLLFLGVSGAFSQSHAQEKLLPISVGLSSEKTYCSALDDVLIAKVNSCETKKLNQIERAIKSQANTDTVQTPIFSYTTESALYIPPVSIEPTTTPTVTTVSPTPIAQTPTDNVPADSTSLNSDTIFDLINAHRAQIGMPAFQKDDALCTLAKTRSLELHDELFVNHNLHSGLYNRNLPYWITEDAKWGSNEAGTVRWWLNSPIHRHAIEGDYVYSCGACQGSLCSQLFTSYTPKNSNPQASLNSTPPQL